MVKGSSGTDWLFRVVHNVQMSEVRKKLEAMSEELSKRSSGRKADELLTSKQVAPLLGVTHHKTVERWVREKGLPCVRIGRNLRFRLGDVLQWQAQQER